MKINLSFKNSNFLLNYDTCVIKNMELLLSFKQLLKNININKEIIKLKYNNKNNESPAIFFNLINVSVIIKNSLRDLLNDVDYLLKNFDYINLFEDIHNITNNISDKAILFNKESNNNYYFNNYINLNNFLKT